MTLRRHPAQHGLSYWFNRPFLKPEPYMINLVGQTDPASQHYASCRYCGVKPSHLICRHEGPHIPVCTACLDGC